MAIGALQVASPLIPAARGETPGKDRHGRSDHRRLCGHRAGRGGNGALYAAEDLNKNGGILGRPAELQIEGISANDVGTGVQKMRKLIERDQVSFIIGDANSGIALAMTTGNEGEESPPHAPVAPPTRSPD